MFDVGLKHHVRAYVMLCAGALALGANAAEPTLTLVEPRDWVLTVRVDAQSAPLRQRLNNPTAPGFKASTAFEISSAVFIYPMLASSAAHETHPDDITSSLSVDGVVYDTTVTLLPDYQAGEQLGRWELPAVTGNLMRFEMDLPMTCAEVVFDEERAMQIPWPQNPWSPLAASALLPQMFVESDDPLIQSRVREWTKGNPGGMRPARLAKFLAAKVMENFRTTTDYGYYFGRHGELAGIGVQGAAAAAYANQGTPTDLAALLCATYRAAGLPARIVVGFDLAASLGVQLGIRALHPECEHNASEHGRTLPVLRTWVEFYLFDEVEQRGEWIPVDIYRQFKVTSKPPPLDQKWTFFGDHPCLQHVSPISFHLHPPTTVVNAGPPALWGWLPEPAIPAMEQRLYFSAREPTVHGKERD